MSTQGSDEFSLPRRCGYFGQYQARQLQCGQNGRLPDGVSGHTGSVSDHVSYDSLSTVRTDHSSPFGSVTINAVSNGQYDLNGSFSSTPYVTSVTLNSTQQSQTWSNEGNQSSGCSCTRKVLIRLAFTLIGLLVGAGIAVAIMILISPTGSPFTSSALTWKAKTSTLVTSSTKTTTISKPSTTETTFGSTYQEKHTTPAADITTSAKTDPRISSTIATEVTSSNPTLTVISTTEVCFRKCHACGEGNSRCPADGNITSNDPGEVMNCPCHTACFSEIRPHSGVQRGCAGDFQLFDERSRANMTCQNINDRVVCFCLGEKCNKHNMTGYPEYKGF